MRQLKVLVQSVCGEMLEEFNSAEENAKGFSNEGPQFAFNLRNIGQTSLAKRFVLTPENKLLIAFVCQN